MKILIFTIGLLIVVLIAVIIYYSEVCTIKTYKTKIDGAEDIIRNTLHQKEDILENIYEKIKNVVKDKDYFKDYLNINETKNSLYELNEKLNNAQELFINIIEDHKKAQTGEVKELLASIKVIDEECIAAQKYFNKNNTLLMKELKGYKKLIATFNKIYIKNSYEIKEPNND